MTENRSAPDLETELRTITYGPAPVILRDGESFEGTFAARGEVYTGEAGGAWQFCLLRDENGLLRLWRVYGLQWIFAQEGHRVRVTRHGAHVPFTVEFWTPGGWVIPADGGFNVPSPDEQARLWTSST